MFKVAPRTTAKIRRTKTQAYTTDWNLISRSVIARDNGRCLECGSRVHLNAHHIIPVAKGGQTTGFNLKTLCAICHAKKHSHL